MCGVLFARRRDKHPVKKALLKRYNAQAARGRKGYGYIAIDNGVVRDVQRFETEFEAEKAVKNESASEILFHHRMPTSTPNEKDMTHPIVVKNKELASDYYVIHNGVLRNENTLKLKHEALGYEYTTHREVITTIKTKHNKKETTTVSFNDSEAFAIELARFLDGKSDKIDAVGTISFICLETDHKGKVLSIHYGHNSGNPLVIENNGDLFFIKSEGNKDDEMVPTDRLFTMDYKTGSLTAREVAIGRVSEVYSKPDYSQHNRQAGFGTPSVGLLGTGERVKSPLQRNGRGLLDWHDDDGFTDDDLPWGREIPTIDFDGKYPKYRDSEEYLIDLASDIESLERDVQQATQELQKPRLTVDDIKFNEEYLEECTSVLAEKKKEYVRLEDKLAGMGM